MSDERLEWIDICKGILILTVVLMHINFSFWSENPVGKYISDFTSLWKVSVFFCVAGLTLKDEKLKNTLHFIKNKIKNVWLKVVVVGLLTVFLHNVLIAVGFYKLNANYAGKIMVAYGPKDFLKQSLLTLLMANREVIIGPLWFVYVLFMALIILALLDKTIRLVVKNDTKARIVRLISSIVLMLLSSFFTNIVELTIPRFNNTLTAVFLIDLCQFLYRELKWSFRNKYSFIIALFLLVNLPLYGRLSMTNNYFENPAFLIVVSICGMYSLFYISQKISGGGIGKMLSLLGKQSFWIVALHFTAFKIGSIVLSYFINDISISSLVPVTKTVWGLFYYLSIGVGFPCFFGVFMDKSKKLVKI